MSSLFVEKTQRWISKVVIGLNLCPFAARVFDADTIRYSLCETTDPAELLSTLALELKYLAGTSRDIVETSFLIHPNVENDFYQFNDFLGVAEELIADLNLKGIIQIVGFHPNFEFEGAGSDAPGNYTNRSPFPMIHLLREESITELRATPEELLEIPKRNQALLEKMGGLGAYLL